MTAGELKVQLRADSRTFEGPGVYVFGRWYDNPLAERWEQFCATADEHSAAVAEWKRHLDRWQNGNPRD